MSLTHNIYCIRVVYVIWNSSLCSSAQEQLTHLPIAHWPCPFSSVQLLLFSLHCECVCECVLHLFSFTSISLWNLFALHIFMAWPDFVSPSLLNYVYVPVEIKIYLPLPFECVCICVCVSFIAYPIKNKIAAICFTYRGTRCHSVPHSCTVAGREWLQVLRDFRYLTNDKWRRTSAVAISVSADALIGNPLELPCCHVAAERVNKTRPNAASISLFPPTWNSPLFYYYFFCCILFSECLKVSRLIPFSVCSWGQQQQFGVQ